MRGKPGAAGKLDAQGNRGPQIERGAILGIAHPFHLRVLP